MAGLKNIQRHLQTNAIELCKLTSPWWELACRSKGKLLEACLWGGCIGSTDFILGESTSRERWETLWVKVWGVLVGMQEIEANPREDIGLQRAGVHRPLSSLCQNPVLSALYQAGCYFEWKLYGRLVASIPESLSDDSSAEKVKWNEMK